MDLMNQNKLSVDIFGERYALKSNMDEQKVKLLAKMLDDYMRDVAKANHRLPVSKIAVLAALNICDSYLKLEQDYQQLVEMIKEES